MALPLVLVALVWAVPQLADACAVCFDASDENRVAFTLTTAFMTFLPLLMIGGVVSWFWRETVRHEEQRQQQVVPGVVERPDR